MIINKIVLLASTALAALVSTPSFAQDLLVDFNGATSGTAGPNQSGWSGVDPVAAGAAPVTLGTISLQLVAVPPVSPTGGEPDVSGRNRAALTGNSLSSLAQDFAFSFGSALDIRLSNLSSGSYTFRGYFHDSTVAQGTLNIAVSTNGGTTFTSAGSVICSTGTSPSAIATLDLSFQATGSPVVIRVTNPNVPTNRPIISGFDLDLLPTPRPVPASSAHALLALLLGLLGATRLLGRARS